MIRTEKLEVQTKGENDIINITQKVDSILQKLGAKEGIANLFLQSTTSALTIIEYEEGLLTDFPRTLERLAPKNAPYEHEKAWGDGNAHSHMRSSLIGVSMTVPVIDGRLALGQWQSIVLTEFDVRPRKRTVIVQFVSSSSTE